jgi:hypothetical protein
MECLAVVPMPENSGEVLDIGLCGGGEERT